MHSFLCAVAVLSMDKRSDSSGLPEALQEILPRCVAEFLIALFKVSNQPASDVCLKFPRSIGSLNDMNDGAALGETN